MCLLRLIDGLVDKMQGEEAVQKKGLDVSEIILCFKFLWLLEAALTHIYITDARWTVCSAVSDSRLGRHDAKY